MKRLATLLVLLLTCAALIPGPVALAAVSPTYGIVDLDAFGAKGDGTTDDAAALTAAVNSAGVLAVRCGPKSYAFASSVTVPAGVRIFGQGQGSTTLYMKTGWTGTILSLGDNCVVQDLTLDGNDDSSTVGGRPASAAVNVRFTRVTFSDFSQCSQDVGANKGLVYDACRCLSSTNGFVFATASSGIVVQNCYFDTLTTAISSQSGVLSLLLRGNTFVATTTAVSNTGGTGLDSSGNAFISGTNTYVVNSNGRSAIGNDYYGFDETIPTDVLNTQTSFRGRYYGNTSPAGGSLTWVAGDFVHYYGGSTDPTIGWVCSSPGTPGTWQTIYRGPRAVTGTWDPSSLAAGASTKTAITTTSLAVGMTALVQFSNDLPDGFIMWAQVTSTTNIDVMLANIGGSTTDVSSGTVTVHLFQ